MFAANRRGDGSNVFDYGLKQTLNPHSILDLRHRKADLELNVKNTSSLLTLVFVYFPKRCDLFRKRLKQVELEPLSL
jgi:hypothetical protein